MENTQLNTQRRQELDDLPEDILLHILSLLPLKDTIRTSVLSRRWKHLWNCMPIFNFSTPSTLHAVEKAQFLDIIERAFTFRDSSSLNAFHLHFSLEDLKDIAIVNSWITASSIKYNVRRLCLCLRLSSTTQPYAYQLLPSCVFQGRCLKELSLEFLDGACAIKLPSPLLLPCLKVLHLKGVELEDDDDQLRKFFSLPTLEVLKINDCSFSSADLHISAPKLRKLYILENDYGGNNTYQVMIHGCSLEYFKYDGPRLCVSALPLSTIISAVIHINIRYKDEERSDHTASLYKLLKGFSSVKYLELSSNLVDLLNSRIELLDRLPVFGNVSELKFGSWIANFNIATLAAVLRCTPYLQTLQFLEEVELSENVEKKDYILDPIPTCCELHLKNIITLDFGSTEVEWSIVGILLGTSKVL